MSNAYSVQDLKDCRVIRVDRQEKSIRIELGLPALNGGGTLTVLVGGVRSETAEYFVGERKTAPHPSPDFPLDEIEMAELAGDCMELQGYLKREPWYVWRIVAATFAITR